MHCSNPPTHLVPNPRFPHRTTRGAWRVDCRRPCTVGALQAAPARRASTFNCACLPQARAAEVHATRPSPSRNIRERAMWPRTDGHPHSATTRATIYDRYWPAPAGAWRGSDLLLTLTISTFRIQRGWCYTHRSASPFLRPPPLARVTYLSPLNSTRAPPHVCRDRDR